LDCDFVDSVYGACLHTASIAQYENYNNYKNVQCIIELLSHT